MRNFRMLSIPLSLCLFLSVFTASAIDTDVLTSASTSQTVSVFAKADAMQVSIESPDEMPYPERLPPDPDKPYVALTFDDGPHVTNTKKVLDILDKYGARATFFVLGSRINKQTSPLLERMLLSGSEIGNHSFDHPILSNLTDKEIEKQLRKTDAYVVTASNRRPTLVRPPYGSINDSVLAGTIGRPLIMWSLDSLDWQSRDTDTIVKRVLDLVDSGEIVLMHDIHSFTVNAVEPIIQGLLERGYQLLTVSELLELREDVVEAGKKYH